MGGGELARDFLKMMWSTKLYLGIVPVLIGEGIPLFPKRLPPTRVLPARKQILLERTDRPQVRPGASQTRRE